MTKKFVFLLLFIGTFLGGYIPTLWGESAFSIASVFWSAIGGFLGIYAGYILGQKWD